MFKKHLKSACNAIILILMFFFSLKLGGTYINYVAQQHPTKVLKKKSLHSSLLKNSAPIVLNGIHDTLVIGLCINNSLTNSIKLVNCYNVTIKNCRLTTAKGNGIDLYKCKNITIRNCYMEDIATGVYAVESKEINVSNNEIKNVKGPFPRGQMVQFNKVSGINNVVSHNKFENILNASNPEDIINMYKTNGTKDSPVQITGNWIRGGGCSLTGGGIMLGDNGGSYLIAKDNVLVNPGQYGIAISGGENITVINNKIFSKKQYFTNVGLYVWNQNRNTCAFNTVTGNTVNWTNSKGKRNDVWDNGNCGLVNGWDTNIFSAKIDSSILPLKIISD